MKDFIQRKRISLSGTTLFLFVLCYSTENANGFGSRRYARDAMKGANKSSTIIPDALPVNTTLSNSTAQLLNITTLILGSSTTYVPHNTSSLPISLQNISTATTEVSSKSSFLSEESTTPQVIIMKSTTMPSSVAQLLPNVSSTNANSTTAFIRTDKDFPLSPAILAVVAVFLTITFFVILYVIFKLVKNFQTVRFRRLHEMPMDDFDDFSGVYVEHTVPFRG